MSELIPTMTITEFRQLKANQIKQLKSIEITSDGEHLFTVIIPHGDIYSSSHIKEQAEYLGMKSNIAGGLDPEEISKEKEVVTV